jgi:DNA-binding transcriptional LysR family regulator
MNVRFDLLTLHLFVAIVEEQSIARAAEKRRIAVSAVSRRISDLEQMLGVELLHRHPKGIEPTTAGFTLLEHARLIIGNVAQLEAELLAHRFGAQGHIRLFANKSAILESLTDELTKFLSLHPSIRIDLEERISPAIVQAVSDNRADLGVFGGNVLAPELLTYPYREDRLVVVVATDHPLAARHSLRFADVVAHEFITLEKGSSIDTLCVQAAAQLGQQLKIRIRVSGFDALLRLVEGKMGLGVVPLEIAEARTSSAQLVLLGLDEPWTRRSLVLGIRSQAALTPAARLLLEHLRSASSEAE